MFVYFISGLEGGAYTRKICEKAFAQVGNAEMLL